MDSNRLEVSTVVYVPPSEAYDFLIDFPRYAEYSEYLAAVTQHGDGQVDTEYDLKLSWWKFAYTTRSRVTGIEAPERIDWEIIKTIDAAGSWIIEPVGEDLGSRVRMAVEFDLDSLSDAEELPDLPFASLAEKAKPKLLAEAEAVVERIVADLEGEPREVELQIHESPI